MLFIYYIFYIMHDKPKEKLPLSYNTVDHFFFQL
jgi:hypothetical protein